MKFSVISFCGSDVAARFSASPVRCGAGRPDRSRDGSVCLKIRAISLFRCKRIQLPQGPRLGVIGADVHTLHAQAFIIGKNSTLEKSFFFLVVASCTAQSNSARVTNSGRRIIEVQIKVSLLENPHPLPRADATVPPAAEQHIRNSRLSYGCPYSSF